MSLGRVIVLVFVALACSVPAAGATSLANRVVVLDPGHNGGNWTHTGQIGRQVWAGTLWKDCDTLGAQTRRGYREAEHNWDVALRVRDLLRAEGARVVLTRASNTGIGPCITRRTAISNRLRADAAVSIHADGLDSRSLRGFHVIAPQPTGQSTRMLSQSRALAQAMRNALRDHGPTPVSNYQGTDGIIYRHDLGGLNLSTVPKVFTEIGNMHQADDAAIIESPKGRQQEAEAIALGITRFLTGRRA